MMTYINCVTHYIFEDTNPFCGATGSPVWTSDGVWPSKPWMIIGYVFHSLCAMNYLVLCFLTHILFQVLVVLELGMVCTV